MTQGEVMEITNISDDELGPYLASGKADHLKADNFRMGVVVNNGRMIILMQDGVVLGWMLLESEGAARLAQLLIQNVKIGEA